MRVLPAEIRGPAPPPRGSDASGRSAWPSAPAPPAPTCECANLLCGIHPRPRESRLRGKCTRLPKRAFHLTLKWLSPAASCFPPAHFCSICGQTANCLLRDAARIEPNLHCVFAVLDGDQLGIALCFQNVERCDQV